MKSVVDEADRDAVLRRWDGADAIIWMFHVSLGRLAIRLERRDESECLYVVGVGSKDIRGPFRWKDARLVIAPAPANAFDSGWRVVDERAGFELLCDSVTLVRGPMGEMDQSFENFLGGNGAE